MRLPTTTLSTRRLSGSRATWSHWSPANRSPSPAQCFCFLVTNDHFSSSCTFRVVGGKGDKLVVEMLGVAAGLDAEAQDRVLIHADQPAGLADAAAVGEVPQHRHGLLGGQAGVEQGRALALREAGLACAAAQQPPAVGAVAVGHRQVAVAAAAVIRAVEVQAAEEAEVVHDGRPGSGAVNGRRSAAAYAKGVARAMLIRHDPLFGCQVI